MKKLWQLQEAKNRFSEVVDHALDSGPQIITRHGKETVVVLSTQDYQALVRPKEGLVEFFHKSPLRGVKLDLERSKDTAREIKL